MSHTSNKQDKKNLLEVENLKTYYPIKGGFLRKTVGNVKAVDNVSFTIRNGETLGLVGEFRLRKIHHRSYDFKTFKSNRWQDNL